MAAEWYAPALKSESMARFLGFVTIFVGVQIVGAILGWLMSKFLKTVGLSWLDRLLGAAFGFVKAGLIAIALVLALTAFPFQPVKDSVARSQAAPYVLEIAGVLAAIAPQELKDGFRSGYEEIQKLWKKVPDKT
jgi:membrane protein required for colicin V production